MDADDVRGRGHVRGRRRNLDPYLPRTGTGHVLLTSRHRHWDGIAATAELDLLPLSDAVDLLLGEAAVTPERCAEAERLAEEHGLMFDFVANHTSQARLYSSKYWYFTE